MMSKMANCKACGKEIASGVNKCVHCGKDQRNFFMKHKIATGIVAIVFIAIIASSGEDAPTTAVVPETATTEVSTTAVKETVATKPVIKDSYAINEAVKLNDAVVTVTKIAKSNGSEYDQPKPGMEFVIVSVSIKNGGTNEISYNPYDFKMQNSKGQITDGAFAMVNTDTQLASGELAANGSITGTLVFEQPKSDKSLILKYNASFFSDKEIKFKLN